MLQRLHTPSKSMIGRVSVWNTLLSTASGDGTGVVGEVDVEEEWGTELAGVTTRSLETVEKHEVDGEDMTQPLHPGDDEVLADEKGTATKAWHVAMRADVTAVAMIIMLATRRGRRESLLTRMDWVRK